jgi:NUDIX domain
MDIITHNAMEDYRKLLGDIGNCEYQRKRNEEFFHAYKLIGASGFDTYEDFLIAKNANQSCLDTLMLRYSMIQACVQEFAICILIDESKKVWISRRNNESKDLCNYFQVAGGRREITVKGLETGKACVIREIHEETGIIVQEDEVKWICDDEYFKN